MTTETLSKHQRQHIGAALPPCSECQDESVARWGKNGDALCRKHYMRKYRERPPVPSSTLHLERAASEINAPRFPCPICGFRADRVAFDCYQEEAIASGSLVLKDSLLHDAHGWFRLPFDIGDYTPVCDEASCQGELLPVEPDLDLALARAESRYWRLLVMLLRAGDLATKDLVSVATAQEALALTRL